MSRAFLVPLLVWAAAAGATGRAADERSRLLKDPPPAAPPPVAVVAPPRAISSEMAMHLTDAAPKFAPLAALAKADPAVDPREADKPRNGIFRLPRYLVMESRIPDFPQRRMLTPLGRIDLALQRHPGLSFGPLAFLNQGWGLAMLEEEERLERMQERTDLLSLLPNPRSADYKSVKFGMDGAFMER